MNKKQRRPKKRGGPLGPHADRLGGEPEGLAARMIQRRIALGLSQVAAAKALGVSRTSWALWETGVEPRPIYRRLLDRWLQGGTAMAVQVKPTITRGPRNWSQAEYRRCGVEILAYNSGGDPRILQCLDCGQEWQPGAHRLAWRCPTCGGREIGRDCMVCGEALPGSNKWSAHRDCYLRDLVKEPGICPICEKPIPGLDGDGYVEGEPEFGEYGWHRACEKNVRFLPKE